MSRLGYLLERYHRKIATEQEKSELVLLLNQAGDDDLIRLLQKEWEASEDGNPLFKPDERAAMLNRILQESRGNSPVAPVVGKRNYGWIRKYAAAAAVAAILLTVIGIYRAIDPPRDTEGSMTERRILNDALPAGNKATLTMSNGKTIVLDRAQNGILAEQGNVMVNKEKDGQLIYEVAGNSADPEIAFHTLSTPRGGQYQIVLPDGSKVWLNAASSLTFPVSFKGKERAIELTGEAYFEIEKNPSKPFKVKSGTTEIEVLGTHFNVMAYNNESSMKTTLLEGAVKIKNDGKVNILSPGQQAVLNKDGLMKVVRPIDPREAIAWKNGLFQFNNTELDVIMREAARWYDLDISYAGPVPQRRFTGKISRNVKASELLSILKYTGVRFEIRGKKIIVMN